MGFWVSVFLIVVLTALALWGAAALRKQRLQRRLPVEVINLGNVESRFQVLAEDLQGALSFTFFWNGARLPEVWMADPEARPVLLPGNSPAIKPVSKPARPSGAQQAISFGGALGSLLVAIGSILPSSVGAPITNAGRQLIQGQSKANRIQAVSKQAADLGSSVNKPVDASQGQPTSNFPQMVGVPWAETPAVQPGENLRFDLLIRASWAADSVTRPFIIKSRSAESQAGAVSVENGSVRIRGGFWSHRFYPSVCILIAALILFMVAFWLSSIGVLV